jgi:hypothetical protein
MKRSTLLSQAATFGVLAAGRSTSAVALGSSAEVPVVPLAPPNDGVPVAFLISDGAVVIDFAGPWEVFQDAHVTGRSQTAFELYTVKECRSADRV